MAQEQDQIPDGFRLRHTLRGHGDSLTQIAWCPDGTMLASSSYDQTIRLWNALTGEQLRVLRAQDSVITTVAWAPNGRSLVSGSQNGTVRHWDSKGNLLKTIEDHKEMIFRVVWSPDGRFFASSSADNTIRLWDAATGVQRRMMRPPGGSAVSLAWSPNGRFLASASGEGAIRLWDPETGQLIRPLRGPSESIFSLAWSPDGKILAAAVEDRMIRLWDAENNRQIQVLHGETEAVINVNFSHNGRFLASRSFSGNLRLWRCDTWEQLAMMAEPASETLFTVGIDFHPTLLHLASLGEEDKAIRIWELDVDALLNAEVETKTVHYTNAKVVLVGDSGVGKSGLGLVMTRHPFTATESTHGRYVWLFDSHEVALDNGRTEKREVLLWDLAGQPGYRLIHQLHLNEVSVAIVVFDTRSETDPFSGVRHWDRALRQAMRIQGETALPLKKFLVAARQDRGNLGVSRDRLEALVRDAGFDGFFATSAKEGWGVMELAQAVQQAIDWDALPKVSSTELFLSIKDFLLKEKQAGRLLTTEDDLFLGFLRSGMAPVHAEDLPEQFETCIGLVESQGLIRRLSFGNLILLQPERIDAYASALVNAVKNEPDGMGTITEEYAYAGRFSMSQDERLPHKEQEKLLLIAMVEDLLRHEIALREQSPDGQLLVFPSQSTRERPDLTDPEGKSVTFTFEGPVMNVYATLGVRLSHSGLFQRKEMWKNAATYGARVGGTCGICLRELEEGQGELILFFDDAASEETRFQFEEFVHAHLQRRALAETIQRYRAFVCGECGTPITEMQVARRRVRGFNWIECSVCGERVWLLDREERLTASRTSTLSQMDRFADAQRDLDVGLVSATGEMRTRSFQKWAGSTRTTLTLVFTDIVASTALSQQLGMETMNELIRAHYKQGRHLIEAHNGYAIKTIGDSLMAGFRTVAEAVEFSLEFQMDPGDERIKIRAGVHVGPVFIEEEDAFGIMVNYASRVVDMARGPEIWLSEMAKSQLDQSGSFKGYNLRWTRHADCELKGFEGQYTLWSVDIPKA